MSDFPNLPTCAACGESIIGPGLCLDCRDIAHRRRIVDNYMSLGLPIKSSIHVVRKTAQEVEKILAELNAFLDTVSD